MKRCVTLICALVAVVASAQRTQLTLENGWLKCFIPNQEIHTYNFNHQWASVHCPTNSKTSEYPKVRIEFAEEKPANLGIIYDYYVGDSIKTSYVMLSKTEDNKTFVSSFFPNHENIAGVSLFAFKPEVGVVKVKNVTLLSADGTADRDLKLIVNDYGGNVTESVENHYSGTLVFNQRWQSINLTGVAGRDNSTITVKSNKGFGKDIQIALVYDGANGESTEYFPISDASAKEFSVKSRQDLKLKNAFVQITTPNCPSTFVDIDGAYIE